MTRQLSCSWGTVQFHPMAILISLGVPQLREMKVQNLEPRASFLRAPQQFCAIAVFIPPIRPGRKSEAEGVK